MAAAIIDGRAAAAGLRARVAEIVSDLVAEGHPPPGLATVLVGEDAASATYVRSKGRAAEEAGLVSVTHRLPASASEAELLALVARLNRDARIHGILVQLPLPPQMTPARVIEAIDPAKDVDGFTIANAGRLATGSPGLVPCTPLGCLILLKGHLGPLEGREAVVVGRSNIVGKPMAQLLLREGATVTIAHSRTRNLEAVCRRAEILVAAVGRPGLIGEGHLRAGVVVVDVGINRVAAPDGGTRLVGDVDPAAAEAIASARTPVPGGVGPMTIACLLANTLRTYCTARGLPEPAGLDA
jgi:methylenetetrahydrofolate dehydrogenase (NADP+)/methenyltetrahydrofolate cyclohydrolase